MNDNDDKVLQILEELRKTTAATGAPKGQPFDAGVNAGMIDRKPDNPVSALPTPTGADASLVGTDMAESISGIVKEDAKKRSELDYLNQFTDAYTPAPLTKEEQERRTRAANAVAGVGALGNAANAISNLIFAGKGAPSQTLPQTVDASAGIRELDETERVRRNEIYQRAKERIAEKRAQDEFKQNMEIKRAELGIKVQESQIRRAQLAANMELAKQRGETEKYNTLYKQLQAEDQLFKNSIAPAMAQLDMFYKQAGINRDNASANASNASAERSRSLTQKDADANEVSLFYDGGQGSFKMRKKDWDNPSTLAAIAKDLGLSVSWEKPAGESGATVDAMKALNQATVTDASGAQRVYTKEQLQTLIGEKLHGVQDAGALAGKFGAGVIQYKNKGGHATNDEVEEEHKGFLKYQPK
jgi:hypothetical protein